MRSLGRGAIMHHHTDNMPGRAELSVAPGGICSRERPRRDLDLLLGDPWCRSVACADEQRRLVDLALRVLRMYSWNELSEALQACVTPGNMVSFKNRSASSAARLSSDSSVIQVSGSAHRVSSTAQPAAASDSLPHQSF